MKKIAFILAVALGSAAAFAQVNKGELKQLQAFLAQPAEQLNQLSQRWQKEVEAVGKVLKSKRYLPDSAATSERRYLPIL